MYFENGGIEQVTNAWFWNNTQQGSPFTIDTEVDGGSDSGGDDRVYIVPGASWSNAIPSFAFLAPYPMPLRDDATPTVVTVVNGVRKLKGIKLNR
jgi:hypothetical protein